MVVPGFEMLEVVVFQPALHVLSAPVADVTTWRCCHGNRCHRQFTRVFLFLFRDSCEKNPPIWPLRSDPLLATSTPTTPTTPSVNHKNSHLIGRLPEKPYCSLTGRPSENKCSTNNIQYEGTETKTTKLCASAKGLYMHYQH